MALFGRKNKDAKQPVPAKEAAPVKAAETKPMPVASTSAASDLGGILRSPRITEKATSVQGAGVYTFDIAPNATKRQIKEAVRALYRVTPRKVAVVSIPTKTRRSMKTGKTGVAGGGRKAYVYLKAGETINLH